MKIVVILTLATGLCLFGPITWASQDTRANHLKDYLILANADTQQGHGHKKLTKEQREQLKRRREYYESLPAEEREKIRRARDRYREMSPEQKQRLRKRWEDMTPDERKRYRKWKNQQKNGR